MTSQSVIGPKVFGFETSSGIVAGSSAGATSELKSGASSSGTKRKAPASEVEGQKGEKKAKKDPLSPTDKTAKVVLESKSLGSGSASKSKGISSVNFLESANEILERNTRIVSEIDYLKQLKSNWYRAQMDYTHYPLEHKNWKKAIYTKLEEIKKGICRPICLESPAEHISMAYTKGLRPYMEDRVVTATFNIKGKTRNLISKISLFACFDGHGGEACAQFMKENIAAKIKTELPAALSSKNKDHSIFNLLKTVFVYLGREFREYYQKVLAELPTDGNKYKAIALEYAHLLHKNSGMKEEDLKEGLKDNFKSAFEKHPKHKKFYEEQLPEYIKQKCNQGCTAALALIIEENHSKTLWTVNVGDSRISLSTPINTFALSIDAKPGLTYDNTNPHQRGVFARGGNFNFKHIPYPVAFKKTKTESGVEVKSELLNMCRAVGHDEITTPFHARGTVFKLDLNEMAEKLKGLAKHAFLVLSSDGLTDVANTLEISEMIQHISKRGIPPEPIAEAIVRRALNAGSTDNIALILVNLYPS